ncbi:hypothetical protein DFA_06112 [Cavenderia fasciculata]|uniref:THH1/TOM1/TOM3 domain-containing protein n=1 Tax=Cavenderia fasciculata TaxID=261658 RepID=F4PK50_CACFS|nr:uncharacterized protein DFA_06112 [Cavenderia fasciculata]EGG23974.1 hypothetical protein DFA_06112 [Cavenderia fasciculata]|eukprot:XP_004361825.1 hypothetical protein DFA_06112 [Cavenderia fasciculata]
MNKNIYTCYTGGTKAKASASAVGYNQSTTSILLPRLVVIFVFFFLLFGELGNIGNPNNNYSNNNHVLVEAFQIQSSQITKKDANVIGVDVSYALMDVTLDKELYLYKPIGACTNQSTCPALNTLDCSCDYASVAQCGSPVVNNGSCPSFSCPTTYTDSATGATRSYCQGATWTPVSLNTQYTFAVSIAVPLQLRLKSDAQTMAPGTCHGITVMTSQIDGFYWIESSTDLMDTTLRTYKEDPHGQSSFTICPNGPGYTPNTYFITIRAVTSMANFTFIAHTGDPIGKVSSYNMSCGSGIFSCIPDGLVVTIPQSSTYNFVFIALPQRSYTIIAPLYNNTFVTIYAYEDYSATSSRNQRSSAKWILNNIYAESITFTMSQFNGSQKLIYLIVDTTESLSGSNPIMVTSYPKKLLMSVTRDFPVLGGSIALYGTSRLYHPVTNSYTPSSHWSGQNGYSPTFPRDVNNPLWPLPYIFSTESVDDFFQEINYIDTSSPKNATYQASFLLGYKGKYEKNYNTWDTLYSSSYIEFNNVLVDSSGTPLEGLSRFTVVQPNCDYEALTDLINTINMIQSQLYDSQSFQVVASLQFAIDLKTMSDVWVGCSNDARQLALIETTNISRTSTECQYEFGTADWSTDPCCNKTKAFFQCCVPKPVSYTVATFKDADKAKVKETCGSPDCTESLLKDYYSALTDIKEGDCTIDNDHLLSYRKNISDALDFCKHVYIEKYCDRDDTITCTLPGASCNMYTRRCQSPVPQLDRLYATCIVAQLPTMATFYLKNTLSLPDNPQSPDFVDVLLAKTSSNDCNYRGLAHRAYYKYENKPASVEVAKCYPQQKCQDTLCNPQHDVCLDGYFPDYTFTPYSNTQAQCNSMGFCNSDPKTECNNATCAQTCNSASGFCGACDSHGECHKVTEITSETLCNTTNEQACLLPNGTYVLGLSDSDCAKQGNCSHNCGYECYSEAYCIQPSWGQSQCTSFLGTWDSRVGVCKVVAAKIACFAPLYWVDCTNFSADSCYIQFGTSPSINNLCSIREIPCTTKESCESNGGSCSDSYYFSQESTNNKLYLPGLGKCVDPTGHKATNSTDLSLVPSCYDSINPQNDSPMGCYPHVPSIFSRAACLNYPGLVRSWWAPATSRKFCEMQMGCRTVQVYKDAIGYRFNQMTESECTDCAAGPNNNVWTNKFTWTPGHWSPGVSTQLSWQQSKFVQTGNYSKVMDLRTVGTLVYYSYLGRISDLLRSSSLCRMERIEENLKSITCACNDEGPGGSECFTTSSVVLGETKPCSEEDSVFEFAYGALHFDKTSVPYYCASVIISSVSRQIYKSSAVETLSSNFVSYAKPDGFAVRNRNNQVVGIVMSDGIKVVTNGVTSFRLCLGGDVKENDDYPIYDFSKVVSTSENDTVGYLVPMGLQAVIERDPKTGAMWVCAQVAENITASSTSTYFAMARQSDWETAAYAPFSKSTTGLIYTLAVIFLLCGLWGMFQLGYVLYSHYFGVRHYPLRLVHMLTFTITLFIVIRCIYFFILPSGRLESSSVADYILVVLPTFIYFSAFTIITVLWYIVISAKVRHDNIMRRIGTIIAVINAILYLLFIAIVLIFQYSAADPPSNECGGRMVVALSKTTPQRIVSIVYAVIQAFISLIIGGAFIYLGGNIYLMVKRSTSGSSATHKRIYIVTLCSSIGFVLHCGFFLILVIAEVQNMIFSFVGLIVTEVVPALSILYAYNQIQKPKEQVTSVDTGGGVGSGQAGGGKLKKMRSKQRLDSSTNNLTLSSELSEASHTASRSPPSE